MSMIVKAKVFFQVIQEAIDEYQKKHGTLKLDSKEMDAEVTVSLSIIVSLSNLKLSLVSFSL